MKDIPAVLLAFGIVITLAEFRLGLRPILGVALCIASAVAFEVI